MKYQAKPVIVDANTITDVHPKQENGDIEIKLDNGVTVTVTPAMTARYEPEVGAYYVVQEDGYAYLNPKEVFERKYEAVEGGEESQGEAA